VENKDKIILAHDSFTQFGGAERVVGAFVEMYPAATMYTVATDPEVERHFPDTKFKTTVIQYFYNLIPKLQLWFAFIPFALKGFKLENAKVVLSSSSGYAKGFAKPLGALHINYCHTPTRFLWSDNIYALGEVLPPLRPLAKLYFKWLRIWDLRTAQNVDYFIANSKEVQGRIKQYYNRDSKVIYPFIDTNFWKPTAPKADYYLIAGRITPYKGYELIIEIFNKLGWPLHVVGDGRYLDYLKSIAKDNISFFGRVSDEELRDQYSGARAFIYPQIEDFGLMPLEAASCGTPTIALAKAGSLETVVNGTTGLLLDEFNQETLKEALEHFSDKQFDLLSMQQHSQQFSKERFKKEISEFIESKLNENHS
jgi:glycosyltransferase involved in cell wall biosynthesis